MFRLDTFRLIKKTFKRFLSLSLIVLIGVAFMMGLMSSKTAMMESVDIYNDKYNLQDIQIYSSYGFCYQDIYQLMNTDGVKDIFASRTFDSYIEKFNGTTKVARIEEMDRNINKYEIVKGRYPEAIDECLVLDNGTYRIGDLLRIQRDDIEDYLSVDAYRVSGLVKTPDYMTFVLGASNLNNKDIDTVVYINNDNMIFDYFTTVYLTLDNCDSLVSYSNEYKNEVKKLKKNIESTAFYNQDFLKDTIKLEYQEKLDDGIKEFNEKKSEGLEKLNEAKKKLDDANIQIITYQSQLDMLDQMINQLKNTIEGNSDEFNELYNKTDNYLKYYGVNMSHLYDKLLKDYLEENLTKANEEYESVKRSIGWAKSQYEKGLKEYAEGLLTFNDEIEKAEQELKKAQQDLDELPNGQWIILDRDSHYTSFMYENNAKQMGAIGYSLPILFYLVAALVCLTTMTRLVDEQRGQIGIFVALGYSNIQIIGKYITYASLASLLGGIIGLFVGQALFPTVIYTTWRLMYDLPPMKIVFPIENVIICLCAFVLLMVGVTSYVVNNTLKEIPAAILRPKAPKKAKAILLEKIPFIWNHLSFTSKITARNIFRYKARFLMTVIGIAGCTGLLVVGWGVKDSISDVVSIQYGNIFNYDYQLKFENSHHLDENIDILESNFDNELVFKFMTYTSRIYTDNNDETINAIVLDPRDANYAFNLRKSDKRTQIVLDNDGVIISEKFAKNNGIRKGDKIIIESMHGIKAEVEVSDICEMYFQHYMFISNAFYQKIFEESVNPTYLGVTNNNKESLVDQSDDLIDFVSATDFNSFIKQFDIMIQALNLIILVIIITAGSLSFVVLINLTQVNISERVREIATLKVLGFRDNEVNSYIFKEIFLLTILGAVIGLPLGTIEHHFIMNVINMDMIMFGMNISFTSYLYSFLVTIVFSLIVSQFMKKPLYEIDMIESLKSVE